MQTFKEPFSSSLEATILVVDDVAPWRARVGEILRSRREWKIIGEACDGLEGVQKALQLRPDLVLLDIGMPVMNGIQAATKIREAVPVTKIVFLTQENDPDLRSVARTTGAEGYVLKANAATELFSVISAAIRNRSSPKLR